jgi:hypothetical protein
VQLVVAPEDISIYYTKKNVEKRVKLDERKKCLYEWIAYIRILDQNNHPSKKILLVWSKKIFSRNQLHAKIRP